MVAEALPPWLALPQEVRMRVAQRFKELFPDLPIGNTEQRRRELLDLSVLRLIEHHQGDIAKAIAFARENPGGKKLLEAVGETEADWFAAVGRCMNTLNNIAEDKGFFHQSMMLQKLVREELQAFQKRE